MKLVDQGLEIQVLVPQVPNKFVLFEIPEEECVKGMILETPLRSRGSLN